MKILSVYLFAEDTPISANRIEPLRDRDAHIELAVKKVTPKTIESIRQTADTAEKLNIRVAIYPHAGHAIKTMPQAIDLAEKVDHPNVGVMFCLCHYLLRENVDDLETVIERAGSRLIALNMSGGDIASKGLKDAIQTLNKGTFPLGRLLKALKRIKYQGPVELKCWGLPGDRFANLETSMAAWKELLDEL